MPVYTVSQVTQYIRQLLGQDDLLRELWISGEVSNLKISQSGHAYFTLKDPESQVRCVMFNGGSGMDLLADGGAITIHGHISFYEARGTVDLITDVVLSEGVGALSLEFERLKATLEREGLFDLSRKRQLPRFPKTIGLVTSPTGSVLHDICKVLARRYPLVEVLLAPSLVQGPDAAIGIRQALRTLNYDGRSDLIILARGGGSLEELWAFNEEPVARAIYASQIPVVSAIGHETDYTIADFVADTRASTPSVAAEMVVPDMASLSLEAASVRERINWAISDIHVSRSHEVSRLASRLERREPDIAILQRKVDDVSQHIFQLESARIATLNNNVSALQVEIRTMNPFDTLQRGYAMVQNASSCKMVSTVGEVKTDDTVIVTVADGAFSAIVSKPDSNEHLVDKPK